MTAKSRTRKQAEPKTAAAPRAAATARPATAAPITVAQVVMTNPKLPDREITVREEAVPHYKRAGWRVKRAQPVTDDANTERAADRNADTPPAETKEN